MRRVGQPAVTVAEVNQKYSEYKRYLDNISQTGSSVGESSGRPSAHLSATRDVRQAICDYIALYDQPEHAEGQLVEARDEEKRPAIIPARASTEVESVLREDSGGMLACVPPGLKAKREKPVRTMEGTYVPESLRLYSVERALYRLGLDEGEVLERDIRFRHVPILPVSMLPVEFRPRGEPLVSEAATSRLLRIEIQRIRFTRHALSTDEVNLVTSLQAAVGDLDRHHQFDRVAYLRERRAVARRHLAQAAPEDRAAVLKVIEQLYEQELVEQERAIDLRDDVVRAWEALQDERSRSGFRCDGTVLRWKVLQQPEVQVEWEAEARLHAKELAELREQDEGAMLRELSVRRRQRGLPDVGEPLWFPVLTIEDASSESDIPDTERLRRERLSRIRVGTTFSVGGYMLRAEGLELNHLMECRPDTGCVAAVMHVPPSVRVHVHMDGWEGCKGVADALLKVETGLRSSFVPYSFQGNGFQGIVYGRCFVEPSGTRTQTPKPRGRDMAKIPDISMGVVDPNDPLVAAIVRDFHAAVPSGLQFSTVSTDATLFAGMAPSAVCQQIAEMICVPAPAPPAIPLGRAAADVVRSKRAVAQCERREISSKVHLRIVVIDANVVPLRLNGATPRPRVRISYQSEGGSVRESEAIESTAPHWNFASELAISGGDSVPRWSDVARDPIRIDILDGSVWLAGAELTLTSLFVNGSVVHDFALLASPVCLTHRSLEEGRRVVVRLAISAEPRIRLTWPLPLPCVESAEDLNRARALVVDCHVWVPLLVMTRTQESVMPCHLCAVISIPAIHSPAEAVEFVSLIPEVANSARELVWSRAVDVLAEMTGTREDHAVVLCSILRGLGAAAWVVAGRGLSDGRAVYVLCRAGGDLLVFDAASGEAFGIESPDCPLLEVACIFAAENMWVCRQPGVAPSDLDWNLAGSGWEAFWKKDEDVGVVTLPLLKAEGKREEVGMEAMSTAKTIVEEMRGDEEWETHWLSSHATERLRRALLARGNAASCLQHVQEFCHGLGSGVRAEGSAFLLRVHYEQGYEEEVERQVRCELRRRRLWGQRDSETCCVGTCRAFPGGLFSVHLLIAHVHRGGG